MLYFTMQTVNLGSVLTKKQSRIFFLPLWSIRPHKPYQNLRPRDSEGLCFIRILKAKSGSREPSPRSSETPMGASPEKEWAEEVDRRMLIGVRSRTGSSGEQNF